MEAITVHYKLSEKEYLEAARLISSPQTEETQRRAWTACVLFPFGVFALAVGAGYAPLPALALACALLPLLIYLYYFRFKVVARRFYRGDRRFREALTVTFTEEHITVQSKLVESKQSWKLYTDVLEGETCYALVYGKDLRMATMLPKRAFRSKQQHMAFRELIGAQFRRTLPVQQVGELDAAENEYQPASLEPPDWR
ncbi:MAG TPA: YcxB family protein [Pyrinomonadaceae bacterium]|nr:YcxB family protein [Pyrinomonadaceae bacterium]